MIMVMMVYDIGWEYGLRVNQFLHLKDSLGKRAAEQLTKAQSEQQVIRRA